MTDAIIHSVEGTASAYDSPLPVKAKARAAVIWRFERDGWSAQDLVTVLDALGLL